METRSASWPRLQAYALPRRYSQVQVHVQVHVQVQVQVKVHVHEHRPGRASKPMLFLIFSSEPIQMQVDKWDWVSGHVLVIKAKVKVKIQVQVHLYCLYILKVEKSAESTFHPQKNGGISA